jgi:hypothetical protein
MDGKDIKEALKQIPELIKTLKAKFSDEKPKEKFTMEWKLKDGSMIQTEDPQNGDDGKIDIGDTVMVIGADGKATVPPDGKMELEDGTEITVAGGIIIEAKPASQATVEDAPVEMSAVFKDALDKAVAPLTKRLDELEKKNAEALKTITAQEQKLKAAHEIQKETFALVEQLAALPVEKPAVEKNKIEFKKEERLQVIAENLSKLKNKK